jgi:hypothetical protein
VIHLIGDIVRFVGSSADEMYMIIDRAYPGDDEEWEWEWVLMNFHGGHIIYCADEEITLVSEGEE